LNRFGIFTFLCVQPNVFNLGLPNAFQLKVRIVDRRGINVTLTSQLLDWSLEAWKNQFVKSPSGLRTQTYTLTYLTYTRYLQ